MDIKIKLATLNKKQSDLLKTLRERGFPRLSYSKLNHYINEYESGPQAKQVLAECEKILMEWKEDDNVWWNKYTTCRKIAGTGKDIWVQY